MTETILVPGGRDVRVTLDLARDNGIDDVDETDGTDNAVTGHGAVVIACSPHPQQQDHRDDARLAAVSDALAARGVDRLRFDYSAWDEGYDEHADAFRAVGRAVERYDCMDLFGFSFGGAMVLSAVAEGADVGAVSVLGPAGRLADDLDVVAVFGHIPVLVQVVCGTHDDAADWKSVVGRIWEYHQPVVEFTVDRFFVGQRDEITAAVVDFPISNLGVERGPK